MTPRRPSPLLPQSRALRGLLALGLSLGLAAPALAQTSPWYLGGSLAVQHDSNLLRLTRTQAAPVGLVRGDTITSASLLAGLDQPLGRQRLKANLALRDNRFSRNGQFDNRSHSAGVALDWATVGRLSGSLSASSNRELARFNAEEIGLLTQRNLETTEALDASLRVGVVTPLTLEAALGQRRVRNSLDQDRVRSRNFDQDRITLGLRWRPRAGSSFGLALRDTRGRYPEFRRGAGGFEADRFTRSDVDLTAQLQPGGASTLSARLSSSRTRYDIASTRDFSGVTGDLNWQWRPSGKLTLATTLARDTGQESYATTFFGAPARADYSRVNETLRLQADWDAGAKLSFTGALQHTRRDLVRTIANPFVPLGASGRDRYDTVTLGARWAPVRWALLACDIGHEARNGSGALGADLRSDSFGCSARFVLQ